MPSCSLPTICATSDSQSTQVKIIRLPDWYQDIKALTWLHFMTPPSKGLRGAFGEDLLSDLRKHQPINTTENHDPMPVISQPGKTVGLHQHPEWTLIYFIDAEDTPLLVEDLLIWPANNTAILLPPGTPHSVRINTMDRPRLSLALRFKPNGR